MTQPEANAGEGEGEIARVPSHVPGLDAILCGGFLRGGLYMVQGPPGAGKTILASQILYGQAAAESRALFVTVLGESHGRMLAHLRPMRFFDPSVIPDKVAYISAYHALEDEGLKGLSTLLRREVLRPVRHPRQGGLHQRLPRARRRGTERPLDPPSPRGPSAQGDAAGA